MGCASSNNDIPHIINSKSTQNISNLSSSLPPKKTYKSLNSSLFQTTQKGSETLNLNTDETNFRVSEVRI